MLVTVILWRIAPPSSLKTAFKLLTTTTVRHNPNSKRYETFMQLIKTIRYSYLRCRRVAGVDGKKMAYFWVVIEVRANSKTKGLERGGKRRARLWRDARTLRGFDTLTLHRRFVRLKKRFWKQKTDCFVVYGWDKEWLSKMLVVKKNKYAFTYQNSENLMSCIYHKCLMVIKKALFLVSVVRSYDMLALYMSAE